MPAQNQHRGRVIFDTPGVDLNPPGPAPCASRPTTRIGAFGEVMVFAPLKDGAPVRKLGPAALIRSIIGRVL